MNKKILLIEDNQDVRENAAEILELANYNVITAENGKIGVEKARKENPDLIICDIMMPELDGYGVLYTLSKNSETATIPFIFLSAKSERADIRRGMTLGADDYLTKPFEEMELLETVESRLHKSELLKKEYNGSQGYEQFVSAVKGLEELNKLSESGVIKQFKKKDSIYQEGQYPRYLYLIQKGKVKTFRTNEEGKEYITDIYSAGQYFGYLYLFEDSPYNENAEALENSELYLIPKDDFVKLIYSNRLVVSRFIQMLTADLHEHNDKLLSLAYNSVRKRVAEALCLLADKYASTDKEAKISFAFSRENLANVVGTSQETAIRVLSDFKDENLIEVQGSTIHIKNLSKLKKMRN